MKVTNDNPGDRIRALFERAAQEILVVAPFIKLDALRSLLEVIPSDLHFRCVTRWLPFEVAKGVSDPEILYLLEERGNFTLSLADRLHAKLYIAGDRCLAGSTNVTLAGLGAVEESNIEVLVETTITDSGIAATLEEIAQAERPATRLMAQSVRELAANLSDSQSSLADNNAPWYPISRRPEDAYSFYKRPSGRSDKAADGILVKDLAYSNLQPGLEEDEFRIAVRSLLSAIPICKALLDATKDTTVTRADAFPYLETISGEGISTSDLWHALVHWMAYFFSDKVMIQEITEIALRRAQQLESKG